MIILTLGIPYDLKLFCWLIFMDYNTLPSFDVNARRTQARLALRGRFGETLRRADVWRGKGASLRFILFASGFIVGWEREDT
jgi:hypothetical protein